MKRNGLVIAGLLLALLSYGQSISGVYTYRCAGADLPLYDFNFTFATNAGGIDEEFMLQVSPQGRIRGGFSAHYDDGAIAVDIAGALNGRVSSDAPNYHIVFVGHGPLSGTAYGRPITGSESFRLRLDADVGTGIASGIEHVTACIAGRGCRSISEPISFSLDEMVSGGGDWDLSLNVTNQNNRISGSAQAVLSSGRGVDFRVRGSYSNRRNKCQLQLRGTGDALGVVIQLTTDSAMNLRSMRGKLFGQRIDMPVESP